MAELTSGAQFSHYRIGEKIGAGGMGKVYVATDLNLNRQVALKVVSSSLSDNEAFKIRFHREAEVLARLDNEHIIRVYEHGEENEIPFIATQFVAGGDLGGLISRRGSLGARRSAQVCAQIADALNDAHKAGIVHRDVKTSNVLIRDPEAEELHAYLCDFGIAQTESGGLTTAGTVAGTWAYLAPERANGAPASPASDIYSLGCLFWACLTGNAPFSGSDVEVAIAHINAPVPQLPGNDQLTRRTNAVLERSLAKNPADRFPTAQAFREGLREIAALANPVAGSTFNGPVPNFERPGWTDAGQGAGAAHSHPSAGSQAPSSMGGYAGQPAMASHSGHSAHSGASGQLINPLAGGYPPQPKKKDNAAKFIAIGAVVLLVAAIAGVSLVLINRGGSNEANPTGPGSESASTGSSTSPSPGDGGNGGTAPTRPDTPAWDYNGDKRSDLPLWVYGNREVRVLPSTGSAIDTAGTLTTKTDLYDAAGPDITGDGVPEIIDVSDGTGTLDFELYRGDKLGKFSVPEPTGVSTTDIYVGDFNGDGKDDIALTTAYDAPTQKLWVFLSNGATLDAGKVWLSYKSENSTDIVVGDFDGNGADDILVSLGGIDNEYVMWLSDGSTFEQNAVTAPDYIGIFGSTLTGDFDGDGADEIYNSSTSEPPSVIKLTNNTLLKSVWGDNSTIEYTDVNEFVGDYNGDGLDDIARIGPREAPVQDIKVMLSGGQRFQTPTSWGQFQCKCEGYWNRLGS